MTIQAISADGVSHEFPDETNSDVIGKVMRDYAQNQLTLSGAVKGGLHDAGTAISQGMNAVGGVMARNGMPEYGGDVQSGGDWLKANTPDAPAGPSPNDQLAGALQHGEYGRAAQVLPYAAVRGLTSAAPVLAASAAGGALAEGAAVPAAIGAGAGMALGPIAYGRAANNGRQEPNTEDVAGAIPGAALSGGFDALLPGAKGIANPLVKTAATIGRSAIGMAGQDVSGQLGSSVGTDKGAQLNPWETAAAATTGAGMGVRDAASIGTAGAKAVSDRAMASGLDKPASPEEAQSVLRVNQLMEGRKADDLNTTGKDRPLQSYANTVKDDLAQKINGGLRDLKDTGILSTQDLQDFRALVNNQARRNNNTIASPDDANTPSLFDKFMASDIPDAVKADMGKDIMDLNTISGNSFIRNGVGPGQAIGKALGQYGGAAYEALQGNVPGAVAAGVFGHGIGARIGSVVGQGIDRTLGLNTPPVVLQRLNAAKVLRQAGLSPDRAEPTGDYSTLRQAADQANSAATGQDFNALSANDQAALDAQAEKAKAQRDTQIAAGYKQNAVKQSQIDAAYEQAGQGPPETNAYLSGKLNDPSLLPPDRAMTPEAIQALRLRNAQAMAQQSARAKAALEQAQQAGTQRQQDAQQGSQQDAALLAQQAEAEQAQRQAQIEAGWRQQNPSGPAPAAPDQSAPPPEVQAYLAGKTNDPSLYGPNRMVPGNELAIQSQRIANAQALLREHQRTMKVLKQAQGDDAAPAVDEVGNPVDDVPTNTPLLPDNSPKVVRKRVAATNPPSRLKPSTPDDVREAVAQDDGTPPPQAAPEPPVAAPTPTPAPTPAAGPTSRLQAAQGALQGTPTGGGMGYIRKNFPDATTGDVNAAIKSAVDAGDVTPALADAIRNGDRVPVAALEDVKAHLRRGQTPRNEGWAVEHSEQARTNASGYQSSADGLASILASQGNHAAAKVILTIKQEPTIANKTAIRDAQPAAIRAEIPDWLVKQGKK